MQCNPSELEAEKVYKLWLTETVIKFKDSAFISY